MTETHTSPHYTPWTASRLVGFDLETTSANPREARIVTAAIISIDPNDPSDVREADWLANPGVEIPAEAAAVHGITTERAQAYGLNPAEVTAKLIEILTYEVNNGGVLVAMNAAYDFTVLHHEALRYGLPPLDPRPVIDPLVLDRQVDPYRRGKRTLTHLCTLYGVTLDDAHSAGADAKAAVDVALRLAGQYPEQLRGTAAELHASQVLWRRDQALGLQDYLRRSDPDAVVETAWPVLPDLTHESTADPIRERAEEYADHFRWDTENKATIRESDLVDLLMIVIKDIQSSSKSPLPAT